MPESPKKAVRYILYGLVFYVAVKYGLPLIAPFAIGLGVAAAVQKPAALLSERIPALSRRTSCVIMTSAVIFGAAVVIYFGVCSLVNGAVSFCPGIPERLAEMKRLVAKACQLVHGFLFGELPRISAVGAETFDVACFGNPVICGGNVIRRAFCAFRLRGF